MINKKLNSLAPTGNAKFFEKYHDYFENALIDKEEKDSKYKNKNIAVMGNYGSGKSSVVKTFFNNNNNYKVLNVSLGSYIVNSAKENFSDIEFSILQQIIYTVRPEKLPYSRYDRIDIHDNTKKNEIKEHIDIIIEFLLIFYLFYIFNKYNEEIFKNLSNNFSFLLSLSIFLVLLGLLQFPLKKILSKFKLNSFKIKFNDKVELCSSKSSSILNENIEELISFFLNTNYDVIVFEDIDRLKEKEKLFNKLKEINQILNNSIDSKTIRFIYCVGDDIFEDGEIRTKFFDVIIPVIPYFGKGNIIDVFNNKINEAAKLGCKLPNMNDSIKYACNFIYNTREIDDIINEYKIFSTNLPHINNDIKEQLLLLMIYKVLYPTKYVLLLEGEGLLYEYFSAEFIEDFRKYKLEALEEKKIELNDLMNIKKKYHNITNNNLLKILETKIKQLYPNYSFNEIDIYLNESNKSICNLQTFFSNPNKYINEIKEKIYLKRGVYGSTFKEEEVFEFCQNKELFLKIINLNNVYNDVEDIEAELDKIDHKIGRYNFNECTSLEKLNYLKEKYMKDVQEKKEEEKNKYEINQFEEFLINSGKITSAYKRLINLKHDNSLDDKDEIILDSIRKGVLLKKGDYEIGKIEMLFEQLTIYDFSSDSICIEEIFIHLLKNKNIDEYLEQFFNNISICKANFLIKLQKNNICIFEKLEKYIINLFDFVDDNRGSFVNLIFDFIKYTLSTKIIPIDRMNDSEYALIYSYITQSENFIKYMDTNISDFEKILPFYKNNIIFDNEFIPEQGYLKIKKILYDNDMYEKNIYGLELMSEVLDFNMDFDRILESTYNIDKNKYVYKIIYEDISKTISDINSYKKVQYDSYETIVKIINTFELNNNDVSKLMEIENNKIEQISDVSADYYNTILDTDSYVINWDNLNDFYSYDNNLLEERLIDIIKENETSLTSEVFNYARNKPIRIAILKMGLDDLKEINEHLIKNRTFNVVPAYPVNIVKLIIMNYGLELKNEKDINDFLINKNYNHIEKAIVLVCSYKYISNFNLNDITNDIIEEMLKNNKLTNQQRVDFCEKYLKDNSNSKIMLSLFNLLKLYNINISNSLFFKVVSSAHITESSKIILFNKYYKQFETKELYEIISVLGHQTDKIIAKDLRTLNKSDDNETYLNILSNMGLLSYSISSKRKNTFYISYK